MLAPARALHQADLAATLEQTVSRAYKVRTGIAPVPRDAKQAMESLRLALLAWQCDEIDTVLEHDGADHDGNLLFSRGVS